MDSVNYFHPMYEEQTKAYEEWLPYQDEILMVYKDFDGRKMAPDRLGKTVRVDATQFPGLYERVRAMAERAGIAVPKIFLYEDYYYGVEAKGADSPRIEISAKTVADTSEAELDFLLAREICRIKHGMVKLAAVGEQVMRMLADTSIVPGAEYLRKGFQLKYASWSRTAHYSADCYGFLVTQDIKACVSAIMLLVLNNVELVRNLNIATYMKQAKDIYLLDDVVARYSENDEKVPYGPLRVKNLIAFATSAEVLKELEASE